MKLRKLCLPALLLLIPVLLGGCTVFNVFSVDQLIRAPKLTGENALIQQAFEKEKGRDVQLVNPLFGKHCSSFVRFDLDRDGIEECIVFYSGSDQSGDVYLHLMREVDGQWISAGEISGSGTQVYQIDFYNLDQSDAYEIAVTWTVSDARRSKTLVLYKYDKSQPQIISQMFVTQIFDFIVQDFDFDGQNELLYLYYDVNQSAGYKMQMIKYSDADDFRPVTQIALSSSIDSPLQISCDIKNATYRLFVDCLAVDGGYLTEIVLYDFVASVLIRPGNAEGGVLIEETHRTTPLYCEDYNQDKLIEVPVQYVPVLSTDNETENPPRSVAYTAFASLENGILSHSELCYYYNTDIGFRLRIDRDFSDCLLTYEAGEPEGSASGEPTGDTKTGRLSVYSKEDLSQPVCIIRFATPADGDIQQVIREFVDLDTDDKLTEKTVRAAISGI